MSERRYDLTGSPYQKSRAIDAAILDIDARLNALEPDAHDSPANGTKTHVSLGFVHTPEDDSQGCGLVDEVAIFVHPDVCSTGTEYDGPFATITSRNRSHRVARAAILVVMDYIDEHYNYHDPLMTDRIRAEVEK